VYTDGTSTLTTYYFFGGAYEVQDDGTNTTTRVYYAFAGMTIAMNDGTGLKYFLTDHLGSVVAVTDDSGAMLSEQRYTPFGEVRTDVGSITQTDFGYTGQRNLDVQSSVYSLGLMDYKARFYDPRIMEFIQPDTLIPEPYNPKYLNRYAYTLNNPINLTDPSGHVPCTSTIIRDDQVICLGGAGDGTLPPSLSNDPTTAGNDNDGGAAPQSGVCSWNLPLECIDEWLWENVPSAIGFHFGFSGQVGLFLEGGLTPAEFLLLFNWRSGELSLFYSLEGFGFVGTPSIFGGDFYGGSTFVKGLSRNQFYSGPSVFTGITVSADAFGKVGAAVVGGKAITDESTSIIPPGFFIDPISQRPIEYYQLSITVGGNVAANGFDAGIFGGGAISNQILTYALPYWPIRR
jgi:RHS repeat-associated protein